MSSSIDAKPREIRGREQREEAQQPDGQQQAERAADHGEQQRLGDELSEQPAAAGAERRAHRHLPLPGDRAREQQVGDVGAGDEQHEPVVPSRIQSAWRGPRSRTSCTASALNP